MTNLLGFEVPKELSDKALTLIEIARQSGKIKRGTNEVTKNAERAKLKLAVIAQDVDPIEIVMHIPPLCEEKSIPCITVPSKKELGAAAGIEVSTGAVGITEAGEGKKQLLELCEKLKQLKGK